MMNGKFSMTIRVINGGLECNTPPSSRQLPGSCKLSL